MQVHNTGAIGSYCPIQAPLTEMHRNWSEGKTIFPVKLREPRPIDKDPSEMTLEELELTQDMEIPTISRQSWLLAGTGTLQLHRPNEHGTTIADRLPEEHPLRSAWLTTKPVNEMTAEELRALDKWYAENTRGTGLTPYKRLHPDKESQIRWERDAAQNSVEISQRMYRNHSGKATIEIRGKRFADDDEYAHAAKSFLRMLRDEWGHVPTIDEIEERGAAIKAERQLLEENNVGYAQVPYEEVYLNGDHHLDPFNFEVFDAEYHSSFEYLADPDLDIDDDFVAEHGLNIDDIIEAMPKTLRTYVRSERDRTRLAMSDKDNTALWHARIGQSSDIGLHFPEPRTMGRVISDKANDLWSKISDPDTTGLNALQTLKD